MSGRRRGVLSILLLIYILWTNVSVRRGDGTIAAHLCTVEWADFFYFYFRKDDFKKFELSKSHSTFNNLNQHSC